MTILKEVFCIGDTSFVNVKISLGITKPSKSSNEQGIKKVQSLIKIKMDEIEQIPGWRMLPPVVGNAIRHAVIRIAFAAYKIGLIG